MRLLAILGLLAIGACQTRTATPVHLAQPGDGAMSCSEIAGEMVSNRKQAAKLAKLDEGIALSNAVAMTLSQVWFWPAIMGVDMSDVEEIEARALMQRNDRLAALAGQRDCPKPAEKTVAVRS
jgi:hypothetical protein